MRQVGLNFCCINAFAWQPRGSSSCSDASTPSLAFVLQAQLREVSDRCKQLEKKANQQRGCYFGVPIPRTNGVRGVPGAAGKSWSKQVRRQAGFLQVVDEFEDIQFLADSLHCLFQLVRQVCCPGW